MADLFDDAGKTPQDDSTNSGGGDDILATLVGEGKPFKTERDLAKGKLEADKFIEQLKRENAEMRDALKNKERSEGAEELVEKLMARLQKASGTEEGNQSTIRPEDISTLVRSEIENLDSQRMRKVNRTKANSVILKSVGDDTTKAKALVQQKAQELGLTMQQLREMAETSPAAFTALMGVQDRSNVSNPVSAGKFASRTAEGGLPSEEGERNFAYYNKLRKELKGRYYEPSIQQQMFRDRERLGDKFFS